MLRLRTRERHARLDASIDCRPTWRAPTGVRTCSKVRHSAASCSRRSRIPAIALTAYTRAVDRTKALRAGFQAHVPKPVDMHELVTVVASVAGRLS